jgi:hypothetical protein
MNFKEFFYIFEIRDLVNADTSHIELIPTYFGNKEGYEYEFIDETSKSKYVVKMQKGSTIAGGLEDAMLESGIEKPNSVLKNVYQIDFLKDNTYSATRSNSQSSSIYEKIMFGIKKLIDTKPVDGISFSPYEKDMLLVYHTFISKLTDMELVHNEPGKSHISNTRIYLKKPFIERLLNLAKNDHLKEYIKQRREYHRQDVEEARSEKQELRKQLLKIRKIFPEQNIIGKFVINGKNLAVVEKIMFKRNPISEDMHILVDLYTLYEELNAVNKFRPRSFRILRSRNIPLENLQSPANFPQIITQNLNYVKELIDKKQSMNHLDKYEEKIKQIPGYNGSLYSGPSFQTPII